MIAKPFAPCISGIGVVLFQCWSRNRPHKQHTTPTEPMVRGVAEKVFAEKCVQLFCSRVNFKVCCENFLKIFEGTFRKNFGELFFVKI